MSASNFQLRRATTDDLVVLRRLWRQAQLPVEALEKRFTEFQIVETPGGDLLGGMALEIRTPHGIIHSQAYASPAEAAELRRALWERLLRLARSYGLTQLWVQSGSSMFWLEKGFEVAGPENLSRFPGGLPSDSSQHWLTLKLRDEPASTVSLEQELELFRQAQEQEGQRILRQARLLRFCAGLLLIALLALIAGATFYVLQDLNPARHP